MKTIVTIQLMVLIFHVFDARCSTADSKVVQHQAYQEPARTQSEQQIESDPFYIYEEEEVEFYKDGEPHPILSSHHDKYPNQELNRVVEEATKSQVQINNVSDTLAAEPSKPAILDKNPALTLHSNITEALSQTQNFTQSAEQPMQNVSNHVHLERLIRNIPQTQAEKSTQSVTQPKVEQSMQNDTQAQALPQTKDITPTQPEQPIQGITRADNEESTQSVTQPKVEQPMQNTTQAQALSQTQNASHVGVEQPVKTVTQTNSEVLTPSAAQAEVEQSVQNITQTSSEEPTQNVTHAQPEKPVQVATQTEESIQSVAPNEAEKSVQNVSQTSSEKPTQSAASTEAEESVQNVTQTSTEEPSQNVTHVQPDRPIQIISRAKTQKPARIVAHPEPEQPVQIVTQTEDWIQSVIHTEVEESIQDVTQTISEEPTQNVTHVQPEQTIQNVTRAKADELTQNLSQIQPEHGQDTQPEEDMEPPVDSSWSFYQTLMATLLVIFAAIVHYLLTVTVPGMYLKFGIDEVGQSVTNVKLEEEELETKRRLLATLKSEVKISNETDLVEHKKYLERKRRLAPLKASIKAIKSRLGDNVEEKIICLKNLRTTVKTNQELRAQMDKLRYEHLLMIRNFVKFENLNDLIRDFEFRDTADKLNDAILELKVEVKVFEEGIETFKRLAAKFARDYEQLLVTIESERSSELANTKTLAQLYEQSDKLKTSDSIDHWKSKVSESVADTEKYYRDYRSLFNKCEKLQLELEAQQDATSAINE